MKKRILTSLLLFSSLMLTGVLTSCSLFGSSNSGNNNGSHDDVPDYPDDPDDPQDPEDPEDPDEPSDPDNPENPDNPDDPNNPDDPDDPTDPDDPSNPDDPEDPTDPEDPDKPVDPDDPEDPVEPDDTIKFEDFKEAIDNNKATKISVKTTYTLTSQNITLTSNTTYRFNYDDGFEAEIINTYEYLSEVGEDSFISTATETYYIINEILYQYIDNNLEFLKDASGFTYRNLSFEEEYFDYSINEKSFKSSVKEEYVSDFMGQGNKNVKFNVNLDGKLNLVYDQLSYENEAGALITSTYNYSYANEVIEVNK